MTYIIYIYNIYSLAEGATLFQLYVKYLLAGHPITTTHFSSVTLIVVKALTN